MKPQKVNSELKELNVAKLSAIQPKTPHIPEENYFDSFSGKLEVKLQKNPRVIRLPLRRTALITLAVAASLGLLVAIPNLLKEDLTTTPNTQVISYEESVHILEEEAPYIDSDLIVEAYLQSVSEESYSGTEEYLIENEVDIELMYEYY